MESLKLHRNLGNLSGIAWCLTYLAFYTIFGGNVASPAPWLEEAITLYRELGDQPSEADVLETFGTLAYWQGNDQEACAYFEQAITLYEKVGGSWSSWPRVRMAYTFLRQGNILQAKETFDACLQHFQKDGPLLGLIYTIEGLASLQMTQGQPERAAALFAWADAMREKLGDQRVPVEQNSVESDIAIIRSHLDDVVFERAYQTGRTMTMEQAIALGRER